MTSCRPVSDGNLYDEFIFFAWTAATASGALGEDKKKKDSVLADFLEISQAARYKSEYKYENLIYF